MNSINVEINIGSHDSCSSDIDAIKSRLIETLDLLGYDKKKEERGCAYTKFQFRKTDGN